MTMENDPDKTLRILHLEDSPLDAEIIRERLIDAGFSFQLDWASNEKDFTDFLCSGSYDLILADYHLPTLEGDDALRLSKLHSPDVPFICVSGAIGEIKAVELLKQGATDYVSKNMLDKLSLAIVRALDEERERRKHRLAVESLRLEKNRAQSYLDTVETIILALDSAGLIRSINRKGCEILGYCEADLLGKNWFLTCLPQPEGMEKVYPYFLRLLSGKTEYIEYVENQVITRSGKLRQIAWHNSLLSDEEGTFAGILSSGDDITERKALEMELLQAQKMESVGRLAGGVAHDFNNMLSVILGHAEMILMRIEPSHQFFDELVEIRKAAERSADLTRQLLAFARKQTIDPKVLDLNEIVAGMLKMLQRLIGENIQLTWKPAADLWQVKMDPSQVDQILANLCVNARDAITDIGKITLETDNRSFDAHYCATRPDVLPGEYVRFVVSDNGSGMTRETQSHIFEPFFTTKGVGEGSGLGLATVFGIVKQNHGFINIYSEPGSGSTFTIYLPRYESKTILKQIEIEPEPVLRGQETILLVEDEPSLLEMTQMILESLGYTVMVAQSPDEAIRRVREHSAAIHLLMTDVMMPGMNGKDLAEQIRSILPEIKCLFMSGYTADIIGNHGVLEKGIHFIQKPYLIQDLAIKVREALAES